MTIANYNCGKISHFCFCQQKQCFISFVYLSFDGVQVHVEEEMLDSPFLR